MEEAYGILVISANKLKSLMEEMVTDEKRSVLHLSLLGASLSRHYHYLSQASIRVVEHNLRSEISRKLRKSVLALGKLCLELIKVLSNIEWSNENHFVITKNYVTKDRSDKIVQEVDQILYIVRIMEASPVKPSINIYENAFKSIVDLKKSFNSFERSLKTPEESHELTNKRIKKLLFDFYVLYHTLKMVISNLASSTDEAILVSLEMFISSLAAISRGILSHARVAAEDTEILYMYMEDLFRSSLALLADAGNSKINQIHNKETLKMSCKTPSKRESLERFLRIPDHHKLVDYLTLWTGVFFVGFMVSSSTAR